MKAGPYRHHFILAFFLIFTTACATSPTKTDTSFVAERWSATLAAFNIDAVFPPRYIQVGDIYLMMVRTPKTKDAEEDKDRYRRRSILLGRADVHAAMQQDMRKMLRLSPAAISNTSGDIFDTEGKVTRFSPTVYPGFNIAAVTESDLGISFPLKIFRSLFGVASSHQLVMSISIPDAEDYELPALEAYDALVHFCAPSRFERRCDRDEKKLNLAITSVLEPDDDVEALTPKIVIITHVFYARQIDYYYSTKAAAGLMAGVSPHWGGSEPLGQSTTSLPSNAKIIPAMSDDIREEVHTLSSQVNDLYKQMAASEAGGSGRVYTAGSEGVRIRQTFDHPVAIGYRGLWIEAKKASSEKERPAPENTERLTAP